MSDVAEYRRGRRATVPCPSRAAYQRGCRCNGCQQAELEYKRTQYPRRHKRWAERNKAKKLAAQRLKEAHLTEFNRLYTAALFEIRNPS